MRPLLNPLPLDCSGKSTANRTKSEVHDLADQFQLPYRIVVMQNGYFYNDEEAALSITDNRGYRLKEGSDFQTLLLNPSIVAISGKPAFAMIVVTNESVGNTLYIDAQMVGGIYCRLDQAIVAQAVNTIVSSNRKLYWRNIRDKPNAYRPSGHLHALWELYGFTYQTSIIARMTTAKKKAFDNLFDDLYDQFDKVFDGANTTLDLAKNTLKDHIADTNNPHKLTRAMTNLTAVVDGPVATQAQAESSNGTILNAYATPLRSRQSIAFNFTPQLTSHINDFNNPHKVTAAQIGAVTIDQVESIANAYVDRGKSVSSALSVRVGTSTNYTYDKFVTYLRTNIPIINISLGILPFSMYSKTQPEDKNGSPKGSDAFLVPQRFGYFQFIKTDWIVQSWKAAAEN